MHKSLIFLLALAMEYLWTIFQIDAIQWMILPDAYPLDGDLSTG